MEEAYTGGHRTVTLAGPDGSRTLEVTIPPGVADGQRIRLAGQGGQGGDPGGGPGARASAGDLYFVVRIADHPRYRVDGRDVYVDLPVAPWEAALGASVELRAPDGVVTVKVPAGTSSGRRLRLRGHGLPATSEERAAICMRWLASSCPASSSGEERKLFEKLAHSSKFDPRKVTSSAAAMSAQRMYALVAAPRLDVEAFARATGIHPDLVTRLVALGLLDVERDSRGQPVFPAEPDRRLRLASSGCAKGCHSTMQRLESWSICSIG